LTHEDVLQIVENEKPYGVIVQFGGQTPLKLAESLEKAGVPILGTSPDSIDRAEDRRRFKEFLEKLFRKYLYDFDLNVEGLGFSVDFAEALNKPLLEEILVEEFGFLAPQVAGEIKEALAGAKTLDEAVGVVLSHVEEEETKKKIEEHKKKLFRI
jgi:hypothetical protein